MTLTRIQNATNTMYNGYRPGAIIEVEHPEALLIAGRIKIGEGEESTDLAIATMTKAQLVEYAKEKGIEVNSKARVDDIRDQIVKAEEETEVVDLDKVSDEELATIAKENGVELTGDEGREEIIEKIVAKNQEQGFIS